MHPMDSPYQDLANAIVCQAANDYRNALDGIGYYNRTPESIITECEKFFRSSRFKMFTKVKGEYLIEQIRKEHEEKEVKHRECNFNTTD